MCRIAFSDGVTAHLFPWVAPSRRLHSKPRGLSRYPDPAMAEQSFSIETSADILDGSPVITVRGEVDVATAPALAQEPLSQVETGWSRLVVDLDEVTFLDSSGIAAPVAAWWKTQDVGGSVSIRHATSQIRRVLEITGVDRLLALE
jgi:anti-sigma B factor antagonist